MMPSGTADVLWPLGGRDDGAGCGGRDSTITAAPDGSRLISPETKICMVVVWQARVANDTLLAEIATCFISKTHRLPNGQTYRVFSFRTVEFSGLRQPRTLLLTGGKGAQVSAIP